MISFDCQQHDNAVNNHNIKQELYLAYIGTKITLFVYLCVCGAPTGGQAVALPEVHQAVSSSPVYSHYNLLHCQAWHFPFLVRKQSACRVFLEAIK